MPREEGEYSCPICSEQNQNMFYNNDRKMLEEHLITDHTHKTLAREFILLFEDYEEVSQELDEQEDKVRPPTKYLT